MVESVTQTDKAIGPLLADGVRFYRDGQIANAVNAFETVLSIEPDQLDALHILGVIKARTGDVQKGLVLLNQAIDARPDFSEALYNLGLVLQSQNLFQDALLAYTRAAHSKHGYTMAWNNLGVLYSNLGMLPEAITALKTGISSDPKSVDLHINLCRTLKLHGLVSESMEAADQGLEIFPQDPTLWIHRSESCFALGKLEEGWDAYKWRNDHPDNPNRPLRSSLPFWRGENLEGKTIAVIVEQGPGETFLFSSMLPEIVSQAKHCIVVVPRRLNSIFKRSFSQINVINEEDVKTLPAGVDVHCYLPDLGRYLRPTWSSFPKRTAHLCADSNRVRELRTAYETAADGNLIVGISWKSVQVDEVLQKSTQLELWKPILATPGVTFVNVQYGETSEEIEHLRATTGIEILSEPRIDPVADLDGHLAQIAATDLVISTSNTAAHAAGALGKPVWCLLQERFGDGLRWFWFADGEDSPWYASARLFRQRTHGDWSDPIARVAIELTQKSAAQSGAIDGATHFHSMALAYRNAGQFGPMGLAADAACLESSAEPSSYQMAAESIRKQGNPEIAIKLLRNALLDERFSSNHGLRIELAASLCDVSRPDEAVRELTRVEQEKPNDVVVLDRLAKALRQSGALDQAIELFKRALEIDPQISSIRENLGTSFYECGKIEEAIAVFDELLAQQPNNIRVASSRAIALLSAGQFEEGWQAYQFRLKLHDANVRYEKFPAPIWNGQSLEGTNILVWTEQGLGEEILASTLMPELEAKTNTVTLLCSERLKSLFRRSFPNIHVEARVEPLSEAAVDPQIDFQMSLADLGLSLRPNVDSFSKFRPNTSLIADTEMVKSKRAEYRDMANGRPLVGISWKSKAPDIGPLKSANLDLVTSLIEKSNVAFVCLQYEPTQDELETLAAFGPPRWLYDASIDPMDNIDHAAVQVAALDYVVTVSNTTVHLSGALGIPTTLLVPPATGRHWYWPRGTEQSLWYNSVRLLETQNSPSWHDRIEELAKELAALEVS